MAPAAIGVELSPDIDRATFAPFDAAETKQSTAEADTVDNTSSRTTGKHFSRKPTGQLRDYEVLILLLSEAGGLMIWRGNAGKGRSCQIAGLQSSRNLLLGAVP